MASSSLMRPGSSFPWTVLSHSVVASSVCAEGEEGGGLCTAREF